MNNDKTNNNIITNKTKNQLKILYERKMIEESEQELIKDLFSNNKQPILDKTTKKQN